MAKSTHMLENMIAWQKKHAFVLLAYKITGHFPDEDKFGLVSQFRRAAVSIEANVAESYKKPEKTDKIKFMNIAQGSPEECRDDIILSRNLNFIGKEEPCPLHASRKEASKLPNGYIGGFMNDNAIKGNQELPIPALHPYVKNHAENICLNSLTT